MLNGYKVKRPTWPDENAWCIVGHAVRCGETLDPDFSKENMAAADWELVPDQPKKE